MKNFYICSHFKAILFVLLFSISCAHQNNSSQKSAEVTINNADIEVAVQMAASFLSEKKLVKSFSQSTLAFHYAPKVKLEELGYSMDTAEQYWRSSSDLYWGKQEENGFNVRALYLAFDPVTSRNYGGEDESWVMFRFKFNEGFRYLDLDKSGDTAFKDFSPEIMEVLAKAGCKPILRKNGKSRAKEFFLKHLGPACRTIAEKTLELLKVDGLVYNFLSTDFTTCEKRRKVAMVLLKHDQMNKSEVKIYSQDSESAINSNSEIQNIAWVYYSANSPISRIEKNKKLPFWGSLKSTRKFEEDAKNFLANSFYDCSSFKETVIE